jgi:hypothetical protein
MVVRFCVLPLWSEILSIKNSFALRAATSMGSIFEEESYLNSFRLETWVSATLWVSRSCMEYFYDVRASLRHSQLFARAIGWF